MSASHANNFVSALNASNKDMFAFIPSSFINSYGVVRNIPLKYSVQDLMNNVISEVPIKSIYRFQRRDVDKPGSLLPTFSIKIEFGGDSVPERILFNFAYLKVDMYVPEVKLCRQCGRLGHTEKYCKGEKRCLRCGTRGTCSCNTLKCILCNSDKLTAVEKNECLKWQED